MNRRMLLGWGVACLLLATALGALVVFVYPQTPGLDQWWNDTIAAVRADWMLSFALALNWIGGGWVAILAVPLATIAVLLLLRRWRGALFAALWTNTDRTDVQLTRAVLEDRYTWLEDGILDPSEGTGPWIAHWEPGASDEPDLARRFAVGSAAPRT